MNNLPFRQKNGSRLFRGNIHTHSNRSDGGMSPEQVCAAYRQQGYDFITITDHFSEEFGFPITDTRVYRDDRFATIIGAELHAPALGNGQDWHILACGLPFDFGPLKPGETGPQLAERALQAGAFVGLAHPAWYGATVADLQSIPGAHAIEAYNEVCGALNDKPESWFHVDQLLATGRRVSAFGADDAHFRDFSALPEPALDGEGKDEFYEALKATAAAPDGSGNGDTYPAGFAAWVWVQADHLEPELLVESLKAGRYYSSQGPVIHDISISSDRSEITVVNTPAVSVYLTGDPGVFAFGANHAKQITRSTFPLAPHQSSFCRVTVVDAAGKRAWSNPIWLD